MHSCISLQYAQLYKLEEVCGNGGYCADTSSANAAASFIKVNPWQVFCDLQHDLQMCKSVWLSC
jgi:hypothetical protein